MSNPSQPLISAIVAVFNGANTLQQCIDSFAEQSYANKELIVIDGGSSDGTVSLLETNRARISYWISEKDKGIYNAWNKGLKQAKGEWICFLGADDFFWDERVLEKMAQSLIEVPDDISVVYGQIMLLNNDGMSLYTVGEPWENIKNRFKAVMCVPHQGVMHRQCLFEKHGQFDESFRIAGDYELLLRELKVRDAQFIPKLIIAGMRQGGISSDPGNTLKAMREIRRAQKMHGQRLPRLIWVLAMFRVYVRLALWRVLGESMTRKLLDVYRNLSGKSSYWTRT